MAASAPPCDCCGASVWQRVFTLDGVDLGRCEVCGLHYVAQMPARGERTAELEEGSFGEDQEVLSAELQREAELNAGERIRHYVDLVERFAAGGKWLDVGCGTGTLMATAQERGVVAEGIELNRDRRRLAREVTGAVVHSRPVEDLDVPPASYAAVTMVAVFSHLTSPRETFSVVHRLLAPGGVLLLSTSEIGPGVKPHHDASWELGEHLYFLGDGTIERYADTLGFEVAHHESVWSPESFFSRERFSAKGRSRARNLVKTIVLRTPGALPLLRRRMLKGRQADNPIQIATIVLRKA